MSGKSNPLTTKVAKSDKYSPVASDESAKVVYNPWLSGYVFPTDSIFNRGVLGALYIAWSIGTMILALLVVGKAVVGNPEHQVLNLLNWIILSGVEVGFIALSLIILSVFSVWVEADHEHIRDKHYRITYWVLRNIMRSRADVIADWSLFIKGFFFSLSEFVILLTIIYGKYNFEARLGWQNYEDGVRDGHVMITCLAFFMTAKIAYVLGQGFARETTSINRSQLNRLDALIDDPAGGNMDPKSEANTRKRAMVASNVAATKDDVMVEMASLEGGALI